MIFTYRGRLRISFILEKKFIKLLLLKIPGRRKANQAQHIRNNFKNYYMFHCRNASYYCCCNNKSCISQRLFFLKETRFISL